MRSGNPIPAPARRSGEAANLIQRALDKLVRELVGATCPQEAAAAGFPWQRFSTRVWNCLQYHWDRLPQEQLTGVQAEFTQLAAGHEELLSGVVLAQALELGYPQAAETFQETWMPLVRATAIRVGGSAVADLVDNFLADLILPRQSGPPKISRYQGRTPFAAWLRIVVTNHCISELRRRRQWSPVEELGELDDSTSADRGPCRELLQPLVHSAVSALAPQDRLMLKLLVLDDVPQQEVARLLGVHSGNVTRRRQRVAESVWQAVAAQANRAGKRRVAADCLELVLAGQDPLLRTELSRELAAAVAATSEVAP